MRQRKSGVETGQPNVDLSEEIESVPEATGGWNTGTWNTFNSSSRRPEAVLEWTIGGMGDGSIRLSVENPTDAGIDALIDLAKRFAELAL